MNLSRLTLAGLALGAAVSLSAKIITDAATGRSKGFGFIEMASDEDADKAIATLNGTTLLERQINVSEARPQREKGRGGPGFGGGGGGRDRRGGFGGGGDLVAHVCLFSGGGAASVPDRSRTSKRKPC